MVYENMMKCDYCQKKFFRRQQMKRHMRKHTGEKPYVCSFPGCSRLFSRQDNMKQHYKRHTQELRFETVYPHVFVSSYSPSSKIDQDNNNDNNNNNINININNINNNNHQQENIQDINPVNDNNGCQGPDQLQNDFCFFYSKRSESFAPSSPFFDTLQDTTTLSGSSAFDGNQPNLDIYYHHRHHRQHQQQNQQQQQHHHHHHHYQQEQPSFCQPLAEIKRSKRQRIENQLQPTYSSSSSSSSLILPLPHFLSCITTSSLGRQLKSIEKENTNNQIPNQKLPENNLSTYERLLIDSFKPFQSKFFSF